MPQLQVDFTGLAHAQVAISRAIHAVEAILVELDRQVRWLAEAWQGAASTEFERAVTEWETASADLRDRLAFLYDLIGTASNNHADAVVANIRMWRR
jgi:WXG100 family type VII secretion target